MARLDEWWGGGLEREWEGLPGWRVGYRGWPLGGAMTPRGSGVGVLMLLAVGCSARRGSYGQAVDSATAACQRNPAYCARVGGEEAVVPLQLRAAQVAAAGKTWQVLDEVTVAALDQLLTECAQQAGAEVNRRELGGKSPTKAQCDEQVGGTRENPVTRAMTLGRAKHELAVQCAQEKLGRAYPGRFSLQQRYRLNPRTRQLELISHEQELAMLREGASAQLVGTVVPDVVIHTGDPLQVQGVYDFKFPCPDSNDPSWRRYPPNHPLKARNQGAAYAEILGEPPGLVTPKGVYK
jgi:hypothetical protein